jgi:hypothetical protein
MNITVEPRLASTQNPDKGLHTLATLGCLATDRLTQLNYYAGLAAIDNSTHHFSTLARSQDFEELVELHMQSLLPATESAKAYFNQVIAFVATTSREFEQVFESQLASIDVSRRNP